VAHLIKSGTMKELARPCNPVLPETARYIYLGRVISGELDKPEKDRKGIVRVISGSGCGFRETKFKKGGIND
jgi:hypothetical protein